MGFLVLVACGSGDEGAAQAQRQETPPAVREQLGDASAQRPELATAQALSATFRSAASHALPAVVFVQVEKPGGAEGQEIPEPFRRFFGLPPGGSEEEQEPVPGAGSGFIIDDRGHVITNHHVIEDATSVIVRLVDGREFTATVVGSDPQTDVAVLKVEPPTNGKPLPTAELGDSSSLQVGDWVLALGSPLELEFTVTTGIVSAMGRQLTNRPSALEAFIQTDAAINPGNSGGPLVDLTGRVVGINTAIFGGPRFVGYGFAIPVSIAKKVVQDILQYGQVRRPQLGVNIQSVTEADAEVYGLPEIRGAEVVVVTPDSPAEAAGLRIGDVILELDGDPVQDGTDGQRLERRAHREALAGAVGHRGPGAGVMGVHPEPQVQGAFQGGQLGGHRARGAAGHRGARGGRRAGRSGAGGGRTGGSGGRARWVGSSRPRGCRRARSRAAGDRQ